MSGAIDRHMLVDEVNHRIQNLLAVIQSVVSFSLVGDGAIERLVIKQRLIGRINAISETSRAVTESTHGGICLVELIYREIRGLEPQFDITGVSGLMLTPQLSQNLTLILNELVANAREHGSLSVPEGRVHLRIDLESSTLSLDWQERYGPPAVAPESSGFGGFILGSFARRFCGEVRTRYAKEGFSYWITLRSD
jgi:two-component sensor histidine kinase